MPSDSSVAINTYSFGLSATTSALCSRRESQSDCFVCGSERFYFGRRHGDSLRGPRAILPDVIIQRGFFFQATASNYWTKWGCVSIWGFVLFASHTVWKNSRAQAIWMSFQVSQAARRGPRRAITSFLLPLWNYSNRLRRTQLGNTTTKHFFFFFYNAHKTIQHVTFSLLRHKSSGQLIEWLASWKFSSTES